MTGIIELTFQELQESSKFPLLQNPQKHINANHYINA